MNKKKNKKAQKIQKAQVKKAEIREYYYMIPADTSVKELASQLTCVNEDQIELWLELDLMEIVLTKDSLLFQNAREVFEDPEDLAFISSHDIQTIYEISYDAEDEAAVRNVFTELLDRAGGMLCSDTEDFSPIYGKNNIAEFHQENA